MATKSRQRKTQKRIRYAVVGLGHIAQKAVLPAFKHAKHTEIAALVSDDRKKLTELGKKYRVEQLVDYDGYDALLASGDVDAVYIALPNHLHAEYTLRAAEHGIHVLCEKPMAVTRAECQRMIDGCASAGVKLMIAYRLHFERSNMDAVEIVQSGRLGEPRVFHSLFTMNVKDPDNIRLQGDAGGGPLYDIGLYCINASRYLFRAEPLEVTALSASADDPRFEEVDEMTGVILRFPEERLGVFLSSFGAGDNASYDVAGTEGVLHVEDAYEYAGPRKLHVRTGSSKRTRKYPKQDQFAPELEYFAECVLEDREPEPSGQEGLIDVAIVEAILESARTRRTIALDLPSKSSRPHKGQVRQRPGVSSVRTIHAKAPH